GGGALRRGSRDRRGGEDRRGGPRARPGRSPEGEAEDGGEGDRARVERSASLRRQRPVRRAGNGFLPRAARREVANVPLPDLAAAHGVRQAVRLVGEGPVELYRDGSGGEADRRTTRLRLLLREPGGTGLHDRGRREERGPRLGARDPLPDRGVALPLEDGPPVSRRARRGGTRNARRRRHRPAPAAEIPGAGEVDRSPVGALPRKSLLLAMTTA